MRLLGLDVGDRRVGVALSDPYGWVAQGLTVLERRSPSQDVEAILRLVRQHQVEAIVVGLPLRLDGTIGPQAGKVQAFVRDLEREARIPVLFWDERFTTAEVQRLMIAAGVRRAQRKAKIDTAAAILILQGYLDSRRGAAAQPQEDTL